MDFDRDPAGEVQNIIAKAFGVRPQEWRVQSFDKLMTKLVRSEAYYTSTEEAQQYGKELLTTKADIGEVQIKNPAGDLMIMKMDNDKVVYRIIRKSK